MFGRVRHKNVTQCIGSGHGSGNVQAQECVQEESCDYTRSDRDGE